MRFMPHTEAETFNRREMVNALSEYLGVRPHYEGMPTKAYTVGAFTVDLDRKSTRLNSSHTDSSRMPSAA